MSADDEIPKRKRKGGLHPHAKGPKFTAQQVDTAENAARALTLRLAGGSYRAIAKEMGVSVGSVHAWIRKSIDAIPRENAKELLAMELEKAAADELVLNRRLNSDKQLTTRALCDILLTKARIRDQRAKYAGLYASVKMEHTVANVDPRTLTDEQIDRVLSGDFAAAAGVPVPLSSGARTPSSSGTA